MNPNSALAGKTQISVQCSQCNFILTKWLSQVKNVDSSVTSFKEELLALQLNFDHLTSSLKDVDMNSAARTTDEYSGGRLWSQLAIALGDCQTTILGVKQSLEEIEYGSRRVSSMLKNVAESLHHGSLFLPREMIRLLEQNIALPVSMINITILLGRPDAHKGSQSFVKKELAGLQSDYAGFSSKVSKYLRSSQFLNIKAFRNMQEFAATVAIFISNVNQTLEPAPVLDQTVYVQGPDVVQVMDEDRDVPRNAQATPTTETREETEAVAAMTNDSDSYVAQDMRTEEGYDSENDDDIELELTLEYMANGQADLEVDDFVGAEENFRRALEMTEENTFSRKLEYGPGDITLMLVDCLMKQEKEEEALELLEPLADGTAKFCQKDDAASKSTMDGSDQALQYKANHILGVVFLKRLDYQAAETRAKQAFKGRRKLLGAQSSMTLESVQLIIDIYAAKNDKINARAYRRFLEPSTKTRASVTFQSPDAADGVKSTLSVGNACATPRGLEKRSPTRSDTVIRSPSITPAPLQTRRDQPEPTETASVQALPSARPPIPEYSAARQPVQRPSNIADPSQIPNLATQTPVESTPRPMSPASNPARIAEENQTAWATLGRTSSATPVIAPPPILEPDPLPPNIGQAAANTRKKMTWASVFSKPTLSKTDNTVSKQAEKDSSDTSSHNASRNSSVIGFPVSPDPRRHMSLFSGFYNPKADDFGGEKESRPSISSRSFSVSTHPPARSRQELTPRFKAINSLRQEGKKAASVDTAIKLLREYDPDRKVLMVREDELKRNMKESHKAMAGTGYGYAPIHFFCERRIEADIEVELLIEQGVDVNAVAYKAGMPGTDPFTPLQKAVEVGHAEIVRLLLDAEATIGPPKAAMQDKNMGNKQAINHPLLIACQKGRTQITYILLAAGGAKTLKEFPQAQWHGNSLLHEACWQANIQMVKMLLDYHTSIKQQHRQSNQAQPDYDSGIIGSPSQQDQFGATPIMHAIDLRDCTNDRTRTIKTKNRPAILKLLLDHESQTYNPHTQTHRESIARILSLKWKRGPGLGHSIFCYADETGDDELTRLLDPYKYQVSPGTRCSASPHCSLTMRTNTNTYTAENSHNTYVNSSNGSTYYVGGGSHQNTASTDQRGRTLRLPSFPELMSTPVTFPTEADAHETRAAGKTPPPPPSFESVVAGDAGGGDSSLESRSPISPAENSRHSRTFSLATSATTMTTTGTSGSARGSEE